MIARLARLAVLLAVLGAIGAFVAAEAATLRVAGGRAEVSRVRAYLLGAGSDPAFAVAGGDRLVRLVTNALVDPEIGGDDVDYAIGVGIQRPGEAVEVRTIHLRSHRSGPLTGQPDPCFDADGTPIADSRHVDLVLDPPAPPGTLITVQSVGLPAALLRAWSSQPRGGIDRAQRLLALYPELRERLGETIGVGAWDHLRDDERDALTRNRFSRLAATGSPGHGFVPRDFYLRGAARVVPEIGPPSLDLTHPATWLLRGPAAVSVHVALPAGIASGTVHVRRVSADSEALATLPLDAAHPEAGWDGMLPEGLQTLVIAGEGIAAADVEVRVPGSALVPPAPDASIEPIEPSISRIRAAPIGPATVATFDAETPADPEARTLEIEVWGTTPADPVLRLRTVARGGETVDTIATPLATNPWDGWIDADEGFHPLRGPARVRLLLPADAERVEVSADVDALVRLRVPFHASEDTAENAPVIRQIGVDDGPALRSWVRPVASAGEVEIRVAGRVEPVPPPAPPPADWVAASLAPDGFVRRFEALERLIPPVAGRVLTEVAADRPVTIRASATGRASARWRYEVEDPSLLGTIVPVRLDGADAGDLRAALSRGTFRLPPLSPGDHVVTAAPPAGIRLFVDVPPAPGDPAPLWRARTVWSVGPTPIAVPVRVSAGAPRAVNVVVYDPSLAARDDVVLTATLDGGRPTRRTHGAYTRATPPRRTWTLPAADRPDVARLVDGGRTAIGAPRVVSFPLGDDLTAGPHVLRVSASRPEYMRLFAVAPTGTDPVGSPESAASPSLPEDVDE